MHSFRPMEIWVLHILRLHMAGSEKEGYTTVSLGQVPGASWGREKQIASLGVSDGGGLL